MSRVRVTEADRGLASLSKTVKVTARLVPMGRLVFNAQESMPTVVNLYAAGGIKLSQERLAGMLFSTRHTCCSVTHAAQAHMLLRQQLLAVQQAFQS